MQARKTAEARGGGRLGRPWMLLALLAGVGSWQGSRGPRPPGPQGVTVAQVAEFLGVSSGLRVDTADYVWGDSGGLVGDLVFGRKVYFLGRAGLGKPRDAFEARVRLTPDGCPLGLGSLENLSDTPSLDEGELAVRGSQVGYTASDADGVRAVSVLDRGRPHLAASAWERALPTGGFTYFARDLHLTFRPPRPEVRLVLEETSLLLGHPEGTWGGHLPLGGGGRGGGEDVPPGVQRWVHERGVPSASRRLWDALVEAGGGALRSLGWRLSSLRGRHSLAPVPTPVSQEDAALPPRGASPPALRLWTVGAFRQGGPGLLVGELDLRQVRLVPVPRASRSLASGLRPGRPQGAIAWAAGLGEGSGAERAGLVLEGRTLRPLQVGHPALVFEGDGPIRAWAGLPSLQGRQSAWQPGVALFPEVSGPLERWLPERPPQRSWLCLTAQGALAYVESRALGQAEVLEAAHPLGCRTWFPLQRSPEPVGLFVPGGLERAVDSALPGAHTAPAPLEEEIDALYFVQRDLRPQDALHGGTWEVDPGWQPEPSWLPSLWSMTVTRLGVPVRVRRLPPSRVAFRLQLGQQEPYPKGLEPPPSALDQEDVSQVALSLGLGVSPRREPAGVGAGGSRLLPVGPEHGALLSVRLDGTLRLVPSEHEALQEGASFVELPLTASGGKLRPAARELGPSRSRQDLCVHPDGAVLLASATFDSEEAGTQVLLDLGCLEVVALDRGGRVPSLERGSGGPAPRRAPEVSALYVLGVPDPGTVATPSGNVP